MLRNIPTTEPVLLEVIKRFHETTKTVLIQPIQSPVLPHPDQHDKRVLLIVVAEQRRRQSSHALHVAGVG